MVTPRSACKFPSPYRTFCCFPLLSSNFWKDLVENYSLVSVALCRRWQGHTRKCGVVVASVTSEGELALQPAPISRELLATPPETTGLVRRAG